MKEDSIGVLSLSQCVSRMVETGVTGVDFRTPSHATTPKPPPRRPLPGFLYFSQSFSFSTHIQPLPVPLTVNQQRNDNIMLAME